MHLSFKIYNNKSNAIEFVKREKKLNFISRNAHSTQIKLKAIKLEF